MHNPVTEVPESSSAYLGVEFRDFEGKLALPVSVDYEIKDLTSNTVVRALQAVVPPIDSKITIHLTPTDNALQNEENRRERRSVTVIANMGGGAQLLDEFRYAVLNVRSHPTV